MANSRGQSGARNMTCTARNSLLPPKCPFPSIPSSYGDYIPSSVTGPKRVNKYRDGNYSQHHRASSESLVIEEQPSWLEELLNEPETPVQRGHRRSSSDSFTYLEAANAVNMEYVVRNEREMRNLSLNSSWGAQDFGYKDGRNNVGMRSGTRGWDSPKDENMVLKRSVSLGATQKVNGIGLSGSEKQDAAELSTHDLGEARLQDANNKTSASETDTKRAKQQFAQRSRVRKLQYIAELERNVHALQTEGFEVSAQLEFLNQQSLLLGMQNKALKQRLENMAKEQLIKRLEHEVLEREIGRLRALYQQQQQQQPSPQQQPSKGHRRTASHDRLDFQFANLTIKNKETKSSVLEPVSSQPRT